MIESKRLPREINLNGPFLSIKSAAHREGEPNSQFLARCRKCDQLAKNLVGMQRKRDAFIKKKNDLFHGRNQMRRDLKALTDDARFWRAVDILFNAVGALISGGSSLAVRQAAGQVISLIGSILGLQTHERKIKRIIARIQQASFDYDRFTTEVKFFQKNIDEHYRLREERECRPTGFVPY